MVTLFAGPQPAAFSKGKAFHNAMSSITLTASDGKEHTIPAGWTVLYFYPKDDTPGCTIEAKEFSDLLPEFKKRDVSVFGISKDSPESHKRFTDKCDLAVTLLSDPQLIACEAYDVLKDKQMFGKRYKGIERSTFILDPSGSIVASWRNVNPQGHAREVLKRIGDLQ